jgi:hypothetical protein
MQVDHESANIRFDSVMRRVTAKLRTTDPEPARAPAVPSSATEPTYEIRHTGGRKWLELAVSLPLVQSARDIEAEVNDGNIFGLMVDSRYKLDLKLPVEVDPDATQISFDKSESKLNARLQMTRAGAVEIEQRLGKGEVEPSYELLKNMDHNWMELIIWLPLLASAKEIQAEVVGDNNVFKLRAEGKYK